MVAVVGTVGCTSKQLDLFLDLFPHKGRPPVDAGEPDAAPPDTGVPDTGIPDAGIPDADPEPDSSTPDGETPDGSDLDQDGDSVPDAIDNCPLQANPLQENSDESSDGGDACDEDDDDDTVLDATDNCPLVWNQFQLDMDRNGSGDGCDEFAYRSCSWIKWLNPDAVSGDYYIDPDGPPHPLFQFDEPNSPPFRASCLMEDSTGWTLVLNYLHRGGTTPPLLVRTDSLPLQGASTLGVGEEGTRFWGHASAGRLGGLRPESLRFYAITSGHPRVIHFDMFCFIPGCVFLTEDDLRPRPDHDANLPATANTFGGERGDYLLTETPFSDNSTASWSIGAAGDRWEVDDVAGAENSTLHRVWAESASDDLDPDSDGFMGWDDNCPEQFNPNQRDVDVDGDGDACQRYPESCSALGFEDPVWNGQYVIDPDGRDGPIAPFWTVCEFETPDGG